MTPRHQYSSPPNDGRPELKRSWLYGPSKSLREAWRHPGKLETYGRAHIGSWWPRSQDIPGTDSRARDLRALLAGAEERALLLKSLGDALSRLGAVGFAALVAWIAAHHSHGISSGLLVIGVCTLVAVLLGGVFTGVAHDLQERVVSEYRRALSAMETETAQTTNTRT